MARGTDETGSEGVILRKVGAILGSSETVVEFRVRGRGSGISMFGAFGWYVAGATDQMRCWEISDEMGCEV